MKDGGAMVKALDLNAGGAQFKTRGGQYVFRHIYIYIHILRGRGKLFCDDEIGRKKRVNDKNLLLNLPIISFCC